MNNKYTVKSIVTAGVIAAIYTAITLVAAPISFGPLQMRIAEGMTLLPLLMPQATLGLFVGCALSNMIGGYGMIDVVVGSLTTLVAAYITSKCKNPIIGGLPPVILNGVAIGGMLYVMGVAEVALPVIMAQIAIGQAASVYIVGLPIHTAIKKLKQKGTL